MLPYVFFYYLFKNLAAVFKVFKLVERRARRREQYYIAFFFFFLYIFHGILQIALFRRGEASGKLLLYVFGIFPYQHRVLAKAV